MSSKKAILLCNLIFTAFSAFGSDAPKPDRWSDTDPAFVPFDVLSMKASADDSFVGLLISDPLSEGSNKSPTSGRASYYILDLKTGLHVEVGGAEYRLEAAPVGHRFLCFNTVNSREEVALYDGLQRVRTFDITYQYRFWWNRRSGDAIFPARLAPGTGVNAYDLLGILEVATGKIAYAPLKSSSEEFWVCADTGHIYTESDEYDSNGKFIRALKDNLVDFSAHCRYVIPGNTGHGPDSWGVHDAKTAERLMGFVWNDDDTGTQPRFWNPQYDHLLLVSTYPKGPGAVTLGILDISRRKIVVSWDDRAGALPRVWSGDGKATVTIRDHRIVFDPVNPEFLVEGTPPSSH